MFLVLTFTRNLSNLIVKLAYHHHEPSSIMVCEGVCVHVCGAGSNEIHHRKCHAHSHSIMQNLSKSISIVTFVRRVSPSRTRILFVAYHHHEPSSIMVCEGVCVHVRDAGSNEIHHRECTYLTFISLTFTLNLSNLIVNLIRRVSPSRTIIYYGVCGRRLI